MARARVLGRPELRRALRRRSVPSTRAWKAAGGRRPVARGVLLLRVRALVHARCLLPVHVPVRGRVPGPPRAGGVANPLPPLGFQLDAPVAIEPRHASLTLRGREGTLYIELTPQGAPPGWIEAAGAGVSARQHHGGGWELLAAGPCGELAVSSGGSTAPVWEVPAASLRWHRPLPGLFEPLGQPFRGSRTHRVLGRALVRLLGVPGIVPLLIRWHRRRTRQRA